MHRLQSSLIRAEKMLFQQSDVFSHDADEITGAGSVPTGLKNQAGDSKFGKPKRGLVQRFGFPYHDSGWMLHHELL